MEYANLREEQLNRIESAQQKLAERQMSLSMKSEELNQMKLIQREQMIQKQQQQDVQFKDSLLKRQPQQQREALDQNQQSQQKIVAHKETRISTFPEQEADKVEPQRPQTIKPKEPTVKTQETSFKKEPVKAQLKKTEYVSVG